MPNMKSSKVLNAILFILGLNLIILGGWRLIDPISFFSYSGLVLSNTPGLLNEARAAGGAIVGFGIVIFLGAFRRGLAFTSTLSAVVLYLGFGIARVISYIVDGDPGAALIKGIVGEFVFGAIALFGLIKYRE